MSDVDVIPELRQIVGAMLFAGKEPLTVAAIRGVLTRVAEEHGGAAGDFARVTEGDLRKMLEEIAAELEKSRVGFRLRQVAKGYRLENDSGCGPWLRELLQKGKPNRLSRPALETLAIIAYRQPCMRSEIEAVRGVAVDQILRNLLEMQLIKVVGRSSMPGRPWLFGTTHSFLEHFGLNDLKELPGIDELRRREEELAKAQEGVSPAGDAGEADAENTEAVEPATGGDDEKGSSDSRQG